MRELEVPHKDEVRLGATVLAAAVYDLDAVVVLTASSATGTAGRL
jgi:hypothetical protein